MKWKDIYYEIRWYPHRVLKYRTLWLWGERMRKVRAKAKRDSYRKKRYCRLRQSARNICNRKQKCELCGNSEQLQVHHKLAVSLGGRNNPENLQVLCRECHLKIHQTKNFTLQH
jgi:5-methylcytosine-specific restriction endonuclease McrA